MVKIKLNNMFKSIKTGLLATVLAGTAIIANAQKKFTQGTITYSVNYKLGADQQAYAAMLPKEQKINFNDNMSKIKMEQGPATITILIDHAIKQGLLLVDVPIAQMQTATKMSKEDIEKAENDIKFSDFKATGEKQKIGDYNAEKYTYKDDKGATHELWSTNEISLPDNFFGDKFKDVKGTLLKYENSQNGMQLTLTFKSITDEKQGPFTLDVPAGYELKTMEELKQLQNGGQ